MKSWYLVLAAVAVVVTCERQRSSNDIIWFPVENEDGIFISTYGEKRRSPPESKWRSHRRARYSGMPAPLPLSFDPTENQDPSFFHNINERRPYFSSLTVPKIPPSFYNEQFPIIHPNDRPQGQGNENFNENSFQEILNEVFDYNKYPPETGISGNKPGTSNQWGNRPANNQNQWGGNSMTENTYQWGSGGQKPGTENQWGFPSNGNNNRPTTSNQLGGTSSRPFERPTTSEWITQGNRPSSRPNKPTNQADKLIFPDETSTSSTTTTTTPSSLNPTEPPTMSPCERLCPVTPEFNPVCGSDSMTYTNAGRLKCAQKCGKDVQLAHYGNCGRTSLVTPLVSNTRREISRGFWFINK